MAQASSKIWKKFTPAEKKLWKEFYEAFSGDENYAAGVTLNEKQKKVTAHNLACQAIWTLQCQTK